MQNAPTAQPLGAFFLSGPGIRQPGSSGKLSFPSHRASFSRVHATASQSRILSAVVTPVALDPPGDYRRALRWGAVCGPVIGCPSDHIRALRTSNLFSAATGGQEQCRLARVALEKLLARVPGDRLTGWVNPACERASASSSAGQRGGAPLRSATPKERCHVRSPGKHPRKPSYHTDSPGLVGGAHS